MNKETLKTLILISLIYLKTSTLNAQIFNVGLLSGINTCKINGMVNEGHYKLGFQTGLFVWTSISDIGSIRAELKYSLKGNNPTPNDGRDPMIILKYLESSFIFAYNMPIDWIGTKFKKKTYFNAGFTTGYLTDSNEKNIYSKSQIIEIDNISNYDIGYDIGLGLRLTENLAIEVRKSGSILPIGDSSRKSYLITGNQYNSTISALIIFTHEKQ